MIAAFILSGIVFKIIGGEPLRVLRFFYAATFGDMYVFSDTLVKATPLILVALLLQAAAAAAATAAGAAALLSLLLLLRLLLPLLHLLQLQRLLLLSHCCWVR